MELPVLFAIKENRTMIIRKYLGLSLTILCFQFAFADDVKKPQIDPDGTIHVPSFQLPESAFLGAETRAALKFQRDVGASEGQEIAKRCPSFEGADMADMPAIRQCQADQFYTSSLYKKIRERYDVSIKPQTIGGVYTEIFTPTRGIKKENESKVLINVHGGGFTGGSRTVSHLESIPIASVGEIKVISIDYRMAPEYQFPAASEDVEKVYRELLKQYKPENIGLYGCSAGGMLTAQSVAWFLGKNLPLPAAIGMFCAGASNPWIGDSHHFGAAITGYSGSFDANLYFKGASLTNSLVFPIVSEDIMEKFPPSLLIAGTRDFVLGPIVKTHTELRRLGVEADLVVWEGLAHAFHFNAEIPESREAYNIIVDFFEEHLGQ